MATLREALAGQLDQLCSKAEQVDGGELAGIHHACREPVMQSLSGDLCNWLGTFTVAEDLRRNDQPHQFPLPDFRAMSSAELAGMLVASRTLARNSVSARAEDMLWCLNDIITATIIARLVDGEDRRHLAKMN